MSDATSTSAEATPSIAERCDAQKQKGNDALKSKNHADAIKAYTKALSLAAKLEEPTPGTKETTRTATLLSNRCVAHLALGDEQAALADAVACTRAAPDWPKAHFRLGTVEMHRKSYTKAYAAFKRGWHIDTSNSELTKACQQAHQAMVGLDKVAPPPASGGGSSNKPMTQDELFALRGQQAKEAYLAREAKRKAAAAGETFSAAPDAPVADSTYREEALRRTAEMAQYVLTRKPEAHSDGRDLLVLTVYTPGAASMRALSLAVDASLVRVEVEDGSSLEVQLPAAVDDAAGTAKFDKKARTLTVKLPVAAPAVLV